MWWFGRVSIDRLPQGWIQMCAHLTSIWKYITMFAKMASMPLLRDTPGCCWESIDSRPFFFTVLHQAPTKKVLFSFFSDIVPGRKWKTTQEAPRKNKRADASKTGRRRLPADKQQQQQHQDLSGRQEECILLVEGKRDRSEKDHSAGGWRMLMRFWMETYTLL